MPFIQRGSLEGGRGAIKDENRLYSSLDQIGGAVEESSHVAGDLTILIHQGPAIRPTNRREKLVEDVMRINGNDPVRQCGQTNGFRGNQVSDCCAHSSHLNPIKHRPGIKR